MGNYDKIEEILSLAWRNDDRMDQETLFDLQDRLAEFALKIAQDEWCVDRLIKKFPRIYERRDGEEN